jgi:hypothetical protein
LPNNLAYVAKADTRNINALPSSANCLLYSQPITIIKTGGDMLFSKIILAVSGFIFFGYGLLCTVAPQLPAEYIGYQYGVGGSTVEIMAMYGGLEMGLGIIYLIAAFSDKLRHNGLWVALITFGGLGFTRLFGLMIHGVDDYNMAALFYELATTGLCITALLLEQAKQSPQAGLSAS